MDKIHLYYVYILTTIRNSVLYTGVTNDLYRRCSEHKEGNKPGFTKKYNVNKLVFYETYDSVEMAIAREKQIKGLSREKKINIIDNFNPGWEELFNKRSIIKTGNEKIR
jgi:putative endonuclease